MAKKKRKTQAERTAEQAAKQRIPILNPLSPARVTSGTDEPGITYPPDTQDKMPEVKPWIPVKRSILM